MLYRKVALVVDDLVLLVKQPLQVTAPASFELSIAWKRRTPRRAAIARYCLYRRAFTTSLNAGEDC
jgi:hypothetical protein